MSTLEIQKRVRYVNDSRGKSTDVLIPYSLFQELLELKTTLEVYERQATRMSIKRAKRDVRNGKTKTFADATGAIEWLRK
jgi:hypothetical protein